MKERPGISNLLQIEALINNRPLAEVIQEWEGKTRYGELKTKVAASVEKLLTEFQANYLAVSNEQVEKLLPEGEAYANKLANATLTEAYRRVGLR